MKIAILSGRPKNGTLLPKEEKLLWEEIKRVARQDLKHLKQATFLIPIYSKFDLYALSVAEKEGINVCYYLPNEEWGTTRLPAFQLSLIERMRGEQKIVEGSFLERMRVMIQDADAVYTLENSDGFGTFKPWLKDKLVIPFTEDKLLYKTEEEAEAYHEDLNKSRVTYITPADKKNLEKIEEENQYQKDFPTLDKEIGLDQKPWYLNTEEEPGLFTFKEIDIEEDLEATTKEKSSSEPLASGVKEEELSQWLDELGL